MRILIGSWDEHTKVLTINRETGERVEVKSSAITVGGHRVFGVQTVGKEVHVLTGPNNDNQPRRRVKFSSAGGYIGSRAR